jgi:hypothetical protein
MLPNLQGDGFMSYGRRLVETSDWVAGFFCDLWLSSEGAEVIECSISQPKLGHLLGFTLYRLLNFHSSEEHEFTIVDNMERLLCSSRWYTSSKLCFKGVNPSVNDILKYTLQSVDISIYCVSGTCFVSCVSSRYRPKFTCIVYKHSARTAQ